MRIFVGYKQYTTATMQSKIENIIESKLLPFSEFIENAEVGYSIANKYQVTYGIDFEIGMDVLIGDTWVIENIGGVEKLTKKQRELIFDMVEDFKNEYIDKNIVA